MKRVTILLVSLLLVVGIAYAAKTVSVNTPGHVHINNGNNAGLAVSPSTLDFGNVTMGDSANITITILNTGNCYEYVGLSTMSTNSTVTISLLNQALTLKLHQSRTLIASYSPNMTATMLPGDYTFNVTWTATCF